MTHLICWHTVIRLYEKNSDKVEMKHRIYRSNPTNEKSVYIYVKKKKEFRILCSLGSL